MANNKKPNMKIGTKVKLRDTVKNESAGDSARRNEKQASARLRGRQNFDDQSNVDKVYQWVKEVTKTKPVYNPNSKHLPDLR